MITVQEAEKLIHENMLPMPAALRPLAECGGCILREDIPAESDIPPFDRVMMDGIAISHAAWKKGVNDFVVEGVQAAGHPPQKLQSAKDGCFQVMTGAVLPEGTDCILPVEQIKTTGHRATVDANIRPTPMQFVHRKGTDRKRGDILLKAGVIIGSPEIAILCSAGRATVLTGRPPSIAVLSIGDELVDFGTALQPWEIRPSNAYTLIAAFKRLGFPTVRHFHFHDQLEEIEKGLRWAIADHDIIIVSGGVSMGMYDFVPAALQAVEARTVFHKVHQRPGKPFWFGLSRGGKPIFALPGNPVATQVLLHRYLLPALYRSMGAGDPQPQYAALTAELTTGPGLTYFFPVRLTCRNDGLQQAAPVPYNNSGDYSALGGTEGFIEVPAGTGRLQASSVVRFHPWRC